jgi:hypothetical protein
MIARPFLPMNLVLLPIVDGLERISNRGGQQADVQGNAPRGVPAREIAPTPCFRVQGGYKGKIAEGLDFV